MNRNPTRTMLTVLVAIGMFAAPMALARNTGGRAPAAVGATPPPLEELAPDVSALVEVDVAREVDTLPTEIEPQPTDPKLADTALVFTNMGPRDAWVKCVGFNKNGRPVGRTKTRLPPLGLRYVLASDISNDHFIGQVQCKQIGRVMGTALFLGPGITDLPVRNAVRGKGRIRFPLVAHY